MIPKRMVSVAALLSLLGSARPIDLPPTVEARSVVLEMDEGKGFDRWCGGLLVQPRSPAEARRVLTASHCVFNLVDHPRALLRARLSSGQIVPLDRDALLAAVGVDGLAPRSQAVAMDFIFIAIGPGDGGTSLGSPLGIRPVGLTTRDSVYIRSGIGIHLCRVVSRCGTQFDVGMCSIPVVGTVSGSPAWVRRGDQWLVAGLVTGGDSGLTSSASDVTTLTSYSAVVAKSSFLTADPAYRDYDLSRSTFAQRYLFQPSYRLPRDPNAPNCNQSRQSLIDTVDISPIADPHVFVGVSYGADGSFVTWDRAGKRLCQIPANGTIQCARIDLTNFLKQMLRGVTPLADGVWMLRFDGGGALMLRRDGMTGAWQRVGTINAVQDIGAPPGKPDTAITGIIEGAIQTASGDLILYGESGLCVVEGAGCRLVRRPPDKDQQESHFTVRAAVEIAPGRIIAAGRDFNPEKAQCVLYERGPSGWQLTRYCGGIDPTKTAYRGINTVLPYQDGVLMFTTTGAVLRLGKDLVARRVPLTGLINPAGARPSAFDDSIRTARWVIRNRLLAVASSDGGFHLVALSAGGDGGLTLTTSTCLSRRDLGLWMMAMDSQADTAVTLSQSGEMFRLRWNLPKLNSYLAGSMGAFCG